MKLNINKKDLLLAFNIAKYVAFIGATICVMIFQFLSSPVCITLALSLYIVAFALMTTTMIVRCVEIFKADDVLKDKNTTLDQKTEDVTLKDGQKAEVVKVGREKFWSIVGAIFFGLFTVFTFVVLVLY